MKKIECNHETSDGLALCTTCLTGWKIGIHCRRCPFVPHKEKVVNTMAHCFACKKYKLVSLFDKDSARNNGLSSRCKECKKQYSKDYLKKPKNRKKYLARRILQRAVRIGMIIRKPCEVCGSIESQGHHHDYNKPYDVVWLCRVHHGMEHRKQLYIL